MNKFEWKQSDRTSCPKCGSTNYKEYTKKQEALMGLFGVIIFSIILSPFIPLIFIPIIIATILMFPVIYFFPHIFLGKQVRRKCKQCRKQWKAFPNDKAEAQ